MIYARLILQQGCTRFTHKIVAQNINAYNEYLKHIEDNETAIIDEYVDDDFGTVVVLPEDFKY